MSQDRENKRWLDPVDRSMESLFGLIMVLTFTGSLSVWTAGRQDVRDMLVGALGCNLAWGLIDACFYLMGILAQRGRGRQLVKRLGATRERQETAEVFAEAIPELVVELMTPREREHLRTRIASLGKDRLPALITLDDLKGAIGVFLWVFLVTFPVALPFLFIGNAFIALRVSNAIAIALLGLIGWRLARYAGFIPWLTILAMVLFGVLMVGITIALGG
ncbi:MAG: hypothetical protein JNL05_09005 [Flavobacteriales bacterium]|nr:hypothetical protein [Flavobacteriales bacterium]